MALRHRYWVSAGSGLLWLLLEDMMAKEIQLRKYYKQNGDREMYFISHIEDAHMSAT